MRSPTWKFSELHHLKFHITIERLTKSLATGKQQVNSISRPSILRGGRGQWKFQSSNHGLIFLMISPYLKLSRGLPVISFLISIWKIFIILKTAKSFKSSMPGTTEKDKYFFYYTTSAWQQAGEVLEHFYRWHHERGKGRPPWGIRITWRMGADKVQLNQD